AREDRWSMAKMPRLHRLRGQVLGLFGAGQIGSLLASKVAHLGVKVVAYDPYIHETRARETGAEFVSLGALLERSDFISLHAPLNDLTRHVFGEMAFSKMKDHAFIINTARGGLIDEAALIAALDSGQIAGAGLDVLESEKAITPERMVLVKHAKVILTPHTAWFSEEAREDLQARAAAQVIAGIRGERPYGLVNRDVAFNLKRVPG
ncbi:MAG: NAD(P)-dependent oxidoreductase, partial [Terriglobia bacterium]